MMNYPKVFLGGLPANVNETNLRDFFSRYGKVCMVKTGKEKNCHFELCSRLTSSSFLQVIEVVIMYNQEKKTNGNGFRGEFYFFFLMKVNREVNKTSICST